MENSFKSLYIIIIFIFIYLHYTFTYNFIVHQFIMIEGGHNALAPWCLQLILLFNAIMVIKSRVTDNTLPYYNMIV